MRMISNVYFFVAYVTLRDIRVTAAGSALPEATGTATPGALASVAVQERPSGAAFTDAPISSRTSTGPTTVPTVLSTAALMLTALASTVAVLLPTFTTILRLPEVSVHDPVFASQAKFHFRSSATDLTGSSNCFEPTSNTAGTGIVRTVASWEVTAVSPTVNWTTLSRSSALESGAIITVSITTISRSDKRLVSLRIISPPFVSFTIPARAKLK